MRSDGFTTGISVPQYDIEYVIWLVLKLVDAQMFGAFSVMEILPPGMSKPLSNES